MTTPRLSRRIPDLVPSPIREILAVIDRPGMISFAGGLPAPETFPKLDLSAVPPECLQYGPSEGEPALRQAIAAQLRDRGLDCTADQVLVLSGSQQGIDLVAKLFVDAGTRVAVESPTYLAALQAFRFFGADFAEFEPATPAAIAGAAFAYVVPTFQNPTGRCLDDAARRALAAACDAEGVTLFEDDPYRDLDYTGGAHRPVCADLRAAPWIYQGSFSKTFAPGLRLGYLACAPEFVTPLTRLKQAADLHSNRVSQWLVLQAFGDPRRDARLRELAGWYRERRDTFAQHLARHFAGLARWELPPGGLFFWLELAAGAALDTRTLLAPALERGVAFMPGEPFHAVEQPRGAIRLNFSHAAPDDAGRGLGILAEIVRDAVARL